MNRLLIILVLPLVIVACNHKTRNMEWDLKSAEKWLKNSEWSKKTSLSPHESVNVIEFAKQYNLNRDLWDKAFAFLSENDLASTDTGKYIIDSNRCWAIISQYIPGKIENCKIESHKSFVDLQYIISGDEKMGIAKSGIEVIVPYNETKDVMFYNAEKIDYYPAIPGKFFLFFPEDIHQPSVFNGADITSKKIVIKIEYKN